MSEETVEDALNNLRLRMNHRVEVMRYAGVFAENGHVLPFDVIGEHFACFLEFFPGNGLKDLVTSAMLDAMGISFADAHQRAVANCIKEMVAPDKRGLWQITSGNDDIPEYYVSNWDAMNHPAGIFNSEFANLPVRGKLLFFPISREKLIITGSESEEGIRAVIDEWEENPYLLPPYGLVREGEKFAIWTPPITNRAYADILAHRRLYANKVYEVQCEKMRAAMTESDAVFPAKYMLGSTAENELRGRCTVTQGVDLTSLPEADFVHFIAMGDDGRNGKELGYLPWQSMLELFGDALECDEKTYPKRYLFKGFPVQSLWQRLTPPELV